MFAWYGGLSLALLSQVLLPDWTIDTWALNTSPHFLATPEPVPRPIGCRKAMAPHGFWYSSLPDSITLLYLHPHSRASLYSPYPLVLQTAMLFLIRLEKKQLLLGPQQLPFFQTDVSIPNSTAV